MLLTVLGAGAGGGLPQWNCGCRNCRDARNGRLPRMTQSSVAVSVNGEDWVVLNASPDARDQLDRTPSLHPPGLRGSPIRAVVLTNADVDHVAGLLTLREKTGFSVFASAEILAALEDNPIFGVLDPALVERQTIVLDTSFTPTAGLTITPFAVPGKVALYLEDEAPDTEAMGEQTIGLCLEEDQSRVYYVPGCATIPDWLVQRLSDADLLLFDGTVWEDAEMEATGTGTKTGARMGHVAMNGHRGSLARLAPLTNGRKVFVHINNTNPVLQPDGPERRTIEAAGWTIAQDGMEFRL
ncbi:Coenzyme PQQ synthesis protein B [Defluviimonas aquaemixtae]|uniref:Coenzyme PQQ synthesis protein B n=1 Tax=Albidovulum aquaemixtae TaxID=1542388 RepID=A0A2R8B3R1_9RHOB|nr:pyrroloquinoline quinone biosynthesis protein PqqB [Defluviimonas aquaemixtae]SPH17248.1 Coenzyme PQQ synthesis protein B [Defluviimonas aquaemixtae]